jgi:hypothetical protein
MLESSTCAAAAAKMKKCRRVRGVVVLLRQMLPAYQG